MKLNSINIQHYNKTQSFGNNCNESNSEKPLTKVQKFGIVASTVSGVGVASALIAKKQGFSLNPKVIFSQNPKNWAMLKIYNKNEPNAKLMEIEEKEILMLAGGSAVGGLAGGAIFDDKKHMND